MKTYNHPDCREPEKVDWVRFYRGGILVIGKVEYMIKTTLGLELKTDNGAVDVSSVLEIKR